MDDVKQSLHVRELISGTTNAGVLTGGTSVLGATSVTSLIATAGTGTFYKSGSEHLLFGASAGNEWKFGRNSATATLDIQHGSAGLFFKLSTTGVLNLDQLTASNDVQTDASKNLTSVSDMRWKDFLGYIEDGLSKIRKLKPRYFKWKRDCNNKDVSKMQQPRLAGFYSQEVHEVFPEGSPGGANIDSKGEEHWGLNSRALLALAIKGIQELEKRIKILEE